MEKLELMNKRLAQVIKEMTTPKFYYAQPEENHMTQLASTQQKEWISRLNMIHNGLVEM